ncbi:hypothetical protein PMPD1_3957 [Paramixta manurensis]|uniref:Fe2OG dioxygenase domain-containing protein n=1 Tax=Paramixta manurensis TaxID=2740817 RepID=A0A6M8UDE3_9GAMM|nr:hypothetical protein PMPD1_3957 [Erwiniaceae bacterium PD-1]
MDTLSPIIQLALHRLDDADYLADCKRQLDAHGALVLRNFLTPAALQCIKHEGEANRHRAFYAASRHNVYLQPPDETLPPLHARNRQVLSSKGCITDEEVPSDSPLRQLYNAPLFTRFLCTVLDEQHLYPYADTLSSINLHYAHTGQELGWHFDNSSFAITLLVQKPQAGGVFEYVSNLRDADAGEMNFDGVRAVLDGERAVEKLAIEAGDLVLFRGRNALHRVTPTEGETTRMLVVLAYNAQPNIALSETARMTFYGRL